MWNNLSPNTVWAPTVQAFKRQLLDEDFTDALTLKYDRFL